ncbi:MAG: exodeoxyribonuclease III [Egibacteraceae bacterium]
MLLATWNVNSLNARLPRVLEFLDTHRPDVLCLQETKVSSDSFPHADLATAGYSAADHSAGRWAGVAILAPVERPLTHVKLGLEAEPRPEEARWIEATVTAGTNGETLRAVSVYVPNGRALDHPAFHDKLMFLDAMCARASALAGGPLLIAGDVNIAPADIDVYDPAAFAGSTHTSTAERSRLEAILARGLVDAFRHLEPGAAQYTWWDYRAGSFHKNLGLRIDLGLLSPQLAQRCQRCGIDRSFRKGPKPSDHAPLLFELA